MGLEISVLLFTELGYCGMILIAFWNFLENIRNEAQETKMFLLIVT